jgi:hypothetical protein
MIKPKLNFNTVQQFELPYYTVTASFRSLPKTIANYITNDGLDLDPPFQRGYVWSEKQRTDFMEYVLRNGELSPIYFNSPDWSRSYMKDTSNLVLVDGKQRLTAILDFIDNKVPVFGGYYCNEIEGLKLWKFNITIAINSLSEADAVRWYISMNTGGSVHTANDIGIAVDHLNEITKGNYVSKKKLSYP